MHDPVLLADYFIAHSGGRLTPLQVIKLAYISHGYALAIHDKPLINEAVEAWRFGPVIPSIYHKAKRYGGDQIPRLLYCGTGVGDKTAIRERKDFFRSRVGDQTCGLLDRILEVYGKLSGLDLIRITHVDGSPWRRCYVRGKRHIRIPDREIQMHYKELIRRGGP